MTLHRIRQGLELPLGNAPTGAILPASAVFEVALVADDYPGLRPRLHVEEGSEVRRGQLLFEDRRIPGARFTAPAAGRVRAVHRGPKRALWSVVIELSSAEREGATDASVHATFEAFTGKAPEALARDEVVSLLVESGLWTALKTRPFGKVPDRSSNPHALFVTAIDTEPLAPRPEEVVKGSEQAFCLGLQVLSKLCEGTTYLCVADRSPLGEIDAPVRVESFHGPHPAGLPGLHVHRLAPVNRERVAWTIGYQDVLSIGRLFQTGRLDVERVVSIAGPAIEKPRLVRTRIGASIHALTREDGLGQGVRLISGSPLSGKAVTRDELAYLGRYVRQVSAVHEGKERELLGWLAPGARTFSLLPVFLSRWLKKAPRFTTSTHGSVRAMVPIGMYERVMPMDILPTHLLRALLVADVERAEALGCLELEEEDLALCTFVCPSKIDYGPVLRKNLDMLEAG